MFYPKPLLPKTLERKYKEAGIGPKKREFLHQFFSAAAIWYGVVQVRDLWEVYRLYTSMETIPKLQRKDLVNFSAIVRREEEAPYYVYEIDELYSEEPRKDLERFVVNKEVTKYHGNNNRIMPLYDLLENRFDKPFYIPEHFSEFLDPKPPKIEKEFREFLGDLEVTRSQTVIRRESSHPQIVPCEHKGEKLRDFDFLDHIERFNYEWLSGDSGYTKGRPKRAAEFLEDHRGPESEKLFRIFKWRLNIGNYTPPEAVKALTDELEEVGVQLNENQFLSLMAMTMHLNNTMHLWCNFGWTPEALGMLML